MSKLRYDVKGSQVLDAFHRVIETRNHDVGMPGLDLALSIRNLTDPQLIALEVLLQQFIVHPRVPSAASYLYSATRKA